MTVNRYTAITISAIIVIIAPFAVSAANIAGAEQVRYRWDSPGMFSFFKLSNGGSLEVCNTLPFWTSFESLEITAYYQGERLGAYTVGPLTMNPLESSVHEGTFSSDHIAGVYRVFMSIDHGISSGDMSIDPRFFVINAGISTPILGLVPYHTTHQVSALEFDQIMKTDDLYCD